ncbi:nucleotidyl transferase AbiEii/AbiGii toxin family protein [Nocardioides mangrovicus]|uniref:nucleotidyl transferase AbiEii/AbiGii toxin family protein n=1 Tax=Nocardioides mangrovicus TaxID=2478913 RepID=UPI00131498EF|nr:nucleotidyl transferase AbiEii/AbiGii toxin family protein [Nocardioides mangrovicus]
MPRPISAARGPEPRPGSDQPRRRGRRAPRATAFDLNEADIQCDYVFGWIISGFFSQSNLNKTAVLKGGNALRKGYLPMTRFSDDLDFSTPHELDPDAVLDQLNLVCEYARGGAGIDFDIDRNRLSAEQQIDRSRHVYKYRLYFKDLIGEKDHITLSLRVDMTEYDRLHLPAQERRLIHPYSDADACAVTLRCVAIEEALADKMKCLLQRRCCYNLFDLVYGAFITTEIEVDRAAILEPFFRKTLFSRSPSAARSLLLDLPLDLFRGFWGKILVPSAARLSFDDAVTKLREGISDLFLPISGYRGGEAAFYPSRLRNLILEAGADRKLMAMTYQGVPRIVEPYSLTFKVRPSDGVGQEYLYVYDRTGGRRSGPGLKSLLHYNINALEVLDAKFEPKFEVTLAKSGDADRTGVFRGNHTASRPYGSSRRPMPYTVYCPRCGKKFPRATSSTRLNAHKDTGGRPGPNRSAIAHDVVTRMTPAARVPRCRSMGVGRVVTCLERASPVAPEHRHCWVLAAEVVRR